MPAASTKSPTNTKSPTRSSAQVSCFRCGICASLPNAFPNYRIACCFALTSCLALPGLKPLSYIKQMQIADAVRPGIVLDTGRSNRLILRAIPENRCRLRARQEIEYEQLQLSSQLHRFLR